MKSKIPIGTEWTVVSTRSNGKIHGKSFGTEAEAQNYAKELKLMGHTEISISKSKL